MQGLPVRLREEFPARLLQGDADLGPGGNVWNWHAVGVSKTLWNMVKACLKVGMPKDNILNIINAVQNPPADEKRDQDQEYDVDNGGVGADIFRREIDNNNQVCIYPHSASCLLIAQAGRDRRVQRCMEGRLQCSRTWPIHPDPSHYASTLIICSW
jgi:hypothetical protein